MDLPTCPSCGQSVLDDDAEDCPFCGSSMSGSPTASSPPAAIAEKPAKSPSKGKKKPAGGSEKPKKRRATTSGKDDKSAEDDPFAVAAPSKSKAVALRKKPEKGRRHQVVCPMCDTPGYTAKKAAGMEVRCANSECLIPVFTAPTIEVPVEDNAEKDQTPTPAWKSPGNIAAVAAVLAAVGVGSWFMFFRDDPNSKKKTPSRGTPEAGPGTTPGTKTTKTPIVKTDTKKKIKQVVKQVPLEELKTKAFKTMVRSLSRGGSIDALKPPSYQLLADAHARAGDKAQADLRISRLANVASESPFYGVRPLVALAWREIQSDPKNGKRIAMQRITEATNAAASLNRQGRIRQDAASELAAVFFVLDKKAQNAARQLVSRHADSTDTGRSSLAAITARYSGTWDFYAALKQSPFVIGSAYQAVAVERILIFKGQWDAAKEWAETQTDGIAKRHCLLEWVEARVVFLAGTKSAVDTADEKKAHAAQMAAVVEVIDRLTGPSRVAANARIAVRIEDSAEAKVWLSKAQAEFKRLPPLEIRKPISLKTVFETSVVSDQRVRDVQAIAIAAAELARAENHGDKTAGRQSLLTSMAYARSLSVNPIVIHRLAARSRPSELAALRNEIARELELNTRAAIETRVKEFRRVTEQLSREADARFRFQNKLLEWAIDWSSQELTSQIWTEIKARLDTKLPAEQREPYLESRFYRTRVPWMLANRMLLAGDKKQAADIQEVIRKSGHPASAEQVFLNQAVGHIVKGDYSAAAVAYSRSKANLPWKRMQAVADVGWLFNRKGLKAAFQFVSGLSDERIPYLKMRALAQLAAVATHRGQARAVWKLAETTSLSPAGEMAFCYGFVVALPGANEVASAPKKESP